MSTVTNGAVQPREPYTAQANPNSINRYQPNHHTYLPLHAIDKTQVLQPSTATNKTAQHDKNFGPVRTPFQQLLSLQPSAKDEIFPNGVKPTKLSSYDTQPPNWPPLFIPSNPMIEKEHRPEVSLSPPPPTTQSLKIDTHETISCNSKHALLRYPPDMSDHKILREFVDKIEEYRALCVEQSQEIERHKSEEIELRRTISSHSSRLNSLKATAKRAVESSRKNIEALSLSFHSLKAQAQQSFNQVADIRLQFSGLAINHESLENDLEKIKTLLDENGELKAVNKAKVLLDELQRAYHRAQEVESLLREKLQNALGELAEARHRLQELEANRRDESFAQRQTGKDILMCMEQVSHLTAAMKERQKETLDALKMAGDLEGKLEDANRRISELTVQLSDRENQLKATRIFHQKNILLQQQLEETNARLVALETARNELSITVNDQETQLRLLSALNADIRSKSENEVKALREELQRLQHQSSQAFTEYRRDLAVLNEQKSNLQEQNAVLQEQKSVLEARILEDAGLKETCQKLQCEIDLLRGQEMASEAIRKTCQVQRDEIVLLTEQKKASEARLAEVTAANEKLESLRGEVAVLQNQKKALLDQHEDLVHRFETSSQHIASLQEQNVTLETRYHDALSDNDRLVTHLKDELQEAKEAFKTLQKDIGPRLRDTSSSGRNDNTEEMKLQVENLTKANEELRDRAATLITRYRTGDLTEDEVEFFNSVMQMGKDIFGAEAIAKGNELRRKEIIINNQEVRIASLEASLASKLQAVMGIQAADGSATTSILNISRLMDAGSPTTNRISDATATRISNGTSNLQISDVQKSAVAAEELFQLSFLGEEQDQIPFNAFNREEPEFREDGRKVPESRGRDRDLQANSESGEIPTKCLRSLKRDIPQTQKVVDDVTRPRQRKRK